MMRHNLNAVILTMAILAMACLATGCRSLPHDFQTRFLKTDTGSTEALATHPRLTERQPANAKPQQAHFTPASATTTDTATPASATPASATPASATTTDTATTDTGASRKRQDEEQKIVLTSLDDDAEAPADHGSALTLNDVLTSVMTTFPLVHAAALQFDVAQGQLQSAEGAFDLKLKAASENGPLGFYETYRHSAGAVQPLMFGGEVFGGYRIGRGDFQPWYQERQTNDGGEFKAGLSVPLARNTNIDDRRAGLQKANIDYSAADPQYRGQIIRTVQDGTDAYWQWVAAGANERIARQVLALATTRNDGLKEEVRTGSKALPVLKDNRRSILSREAKLIDAQRKLNQSAAKLSIYLRTTNGEPRTPASDELPTFPQPAEPDEAIRTRLAGVALQTRPELRELDLAVERVDVELAEAQNDLRPNVDAVLIGSQDLGEPTSKKRDKSEFEVEAALLVDVPLQRRKARGKLASLEAKRSQVAHKRQLTADKIRTEIDVAFAALTAAWQRVQRTGEARELAEFMAQVESDKLEAGESNLLAVALREEQSAQAAGTEVDAKLEYQLALAALRAAAGIDDGSIIEWTP